MNYLYSYESFLQIVFGELAESESSESNSRTTMNVLHQYVKYRFF